jgi:hypothetical protein
MRVRKTETERERERPVVEGEKSEKKIEKKKTQIPFDLISRVRIVRIGDLILGKMEIVH